ncbi:hypothetical protein Tco_0689986, partial [Tanacetum coccineum]
MWFLADKDVFEEEYMIGSEVFDLLKVSDDLFTYDSPFGMVFDKFKRLSSMEDDLFTYELGVVEDFYFPCIEQPHDDLDVYEPRVCYDENEQIYVEAVILINKILVRVIDITVEQLLDLKFGDHKKVDKEIMEEVNALWLYWIRGDDEEVLTDEELEDKKISEEKEIAEIFKIETDIFNFETLLCITFKEFNHLLQIDVDVLTGDLPGFKIYDEYKDAWIYEWNREVPWVEKKPWLDYGTWKEPNDDIIRSGDLKDKALKEKAILEGSWGHENKEGMNFCSCDDAWSNYSPNDDNDAIQVDQERFDSHEPMQDDDIMDLDDYLIGQYASYYVDEEEKRFREIKKQITWDALRETTNIQIKKVQ